LVPANTLAGLLHQGLSHRAIVPIDPAMRIDSRPDIEVPA